MTLRNLLLPKRLRETEKNKIGQRRTIGNIDTTTTLTIDQVTEESEKGTTTGAGKDAAIAIDMDMAGHATATQRRIAIVTSDLGIQGRNRTATQSTNTSIGPRTGTGMNKWR